MPDLLGGARAPPIIRSAVIRELRCCRVAGLAHSAGLSLQAGSVRSGPELGGYHHLPSHYPPPQKCWGAGGALRVTTLSLSPDPILHVYPGVLTPRAATLA